MGISCVIILLAVLIEHQVVADRRTDRHRTLAYTALA